MGYYTVLYHSKLPHRADTDSTCYLAIGTIVRELKLSCSTVKRAIADLTTAIIT
ncbi:hypothetical protein [Paenibacillus durus]|uniref:hypothetical protein n=1 Tax=Paenibacillus durus TaxID=44251 RepID=UPI000A98A0E7|nr:hypothetical protein [Paenibacillus durus]